MSGQQDDKPKPKKREWLKKLGIPGVIVGAVLAGLIGIIIQGPNKYQSEKISHIKYSITKIFNGSSHSAQPNPPVKIESVHVQRVPGMQGDTYVYPQQLSVSPEALADLNKKMSTLQGHDYLDKWAREHGGVDPSWVRIQMAVRGNRDHEVRIMGMNIQGKCTKPLRGTIMASPPAGADDSISIGFDLDSQRDPVARFYRMTGEFGRDYFSSKTISLKPGETQVIEIVGKSFKRYCQFDLNLTVQDNNKSITETVNNNGKHFEVSGLLPLRRYNEVFEGGVCGVSRNGGWVRVNPRKARC